MIQFIIILLCVFFSAPAWSETYYIDFVGGSDSANGTATSTPFKHCPGDTNATGTASETVLTGDDIVIFKGAVQYDGIISLDWSGSSGHLIVYDGDSGTYASRWAAGTDKAIIDGGGTSDYGFYFSAARSYVTINSFEIRDFNETENRGWGIYDNFGSSYITISNSSIHDTGEATYPGISGTAINTRGAYWTITENSIYDSYGVGIYLHDGADHIDIYNNTFTDLMNWAMYIKPEGADLDTINIYNNTFYDIYRYANLSEGVLHVNFIFAYWDNYNISNLKIYSNLFYNNIDFADDWNGTAMIHLEGGGGTGALSTCSVYNNVLSNPNSYYAMQIYSGAIAGLVIYNNSYNSPRNSVFAKLDGSLSALDGVIIKGNSVKQAGEICIYMTGDYTNFACDYNNYYTGGDSIGKVETTYYNWTNWQGLGYDANSLGPTSDPTYAGADATHWDLTIPYASPLVNAFPTAQAPTGLFAVDILDINRPQGAAWDIGAYEWILRHGGGSFSGSATIR